VTLSGLPFPRTTLGRASLLPPPPWHYSGDLLTVEYRTSPDNVRALLPPDVDLANDDEDPGAVAFIWADWQSCGDDGAELVDPVRSQYPRSVRGGALSLRRHALQSLCLYLGGQGLRSGSRLHPGLPQKNRLNSSNSPRYRWSRGTPVSSPAERLA
jgi:acetoacetate decarboxylase